MKKETFTAKPYLYKIISVFMSLASIIILFSTYIGFIPKPYNEWHGYLLAFLGILVAYIIWKIPPPKIEVDESGIKKIISSQVTGLISKLLKPDIECEWNWISFVVTTRGIDGSPVTVLYTSEDIPNQPKYRISVESLIFKDYVSILRIIKERAPQANFDETTSLILNNQLDIRSVRPFFWWLIIIVFIIVLIYEYCKKG